MALEVHGSWVALVAMKHMQHAVQNRGQDDGCRYNEHQTRIQGVAAREQLARGRYRIVNRPHAAERHAGVLERIMPLSMLVVLIAEHAESPGAGGRQRG